MKSSTSTAFFAIALAALSTIVAALPAHEARDGDYNNLFIPGGNTNIRNKSTPSAGRFSPAPGSVGQNGDTSASGNSSSDDDKNAQNGVASGNTDGSTVNSNIVPAPVTGTSTSGKSEKSNNGKKQNGGDTNGSATIPIFRPLLRPPPVVSQGIAASDTNNNKLAQGGTMNGFSSGTVSGNGVIVGGGGDASARND